MQIVFFNNYCKDIGLFSIYKVFIVDLENFQTNLVIPLPLIGIFYYETYYKINRK